MAVVFCCKFDVNFDSECNGLSPTSTNGDEVIAGSGKFGLGSLGLTEPVPIQGIIDLNSYENVVGTNVDEGAIGWWVRGINIITWPTARLVNWDVRYIGSITSNKGKINCPVEIDYTTNQISYKLRMRDNSNTVRVNTTVTEGIIPNNNWHYIEINWLWNDSGGKSELFWDGVSKISNTGGNNFSRVGDVMHINPYSNSIILSPLRGVDHRWDDLTCWDARQHTSNFSVPTVPNCVCGGAGRGIVSLGAPFGGMCQMGR